MSYQVERNHIPDGAIARALDDAIKKAGLIGRVQIKIHVKLEQNGINMEVTAEPIEGRDSIFARGSYASWDWADADGRPRINQQAYRDFLEEYPGLSVEMESEL